MTRTVCPLPPCGGGFGWGVREEPSNDIEDSVGIAKHIVVPEAHDAKSLRFHERRAARVFRGIVIVLSAIDFDDELNFEANEVGDVRADWNLATEAMADNLFETQTRPEAPLGVCEISTQ